MKVVKGIIYFVLIMLAAVLLAALFAPSSKTVSRSISINASQKVVFGQLANFENWKKWDAWFAKDTLQERTYFGTLNDKKQRYSWSSQNEDVGNGRVEMNDIDGIDKLTHTFYFDERPKKGIFLLNTEGKKTTVLWEMQSELDYPFKLMNYFMDPLVGPDFELGLKNLKNLTENMPVQNSEDGIVQIVNEMGINYACIQAKDLPMSEVEFFLSTAYPKIYGYASTNGLTVKGPPCGLYYVWDEESGKASLAAAVPVSAAKELQERTLQTDLGQAVITEKYVACTFSGGTEMGYKVHSMLNQWVGSESKRVLEPIVEEYIKGPLQTADTALHQTKIYYYYD